MTTRSPLERGIPHRLRVSDALKGFAYAELFGLVAFIWVGLKDFRDSGATVDTYEPSIGPVVWMLAVTGAVQLIWIFHISLKRYADPVRDYGIAIRRDDIFLGVAAGAFALGVNVAFGRLLGIDDGGANQVQFSDSFRSVPEPYWLALLVILGVMVPFVEEVFFRGIILRAIERSWGLVAAVLGSSIIFGLGHYSGWNSGGVARVLFATFAGLCFGAITAKTGRIAASTLGHMINNLVATLIVLS